MAFFKAALNELWLECGEGRGDESEPIRFELKYEGDGSTNVVPKISVTSWMQRLTFDNAALLATHKSKRRQFDDHFLDVEMLEHHGCYGYLGASDPCDALRRTIIEAYKLVFALVLDLPVDWTKVPEMSHERVTLRSWTVVFMKVLELTDFFSCEDTAEKFEIMILWGPVIRDERLQYWGLYLPIAVILLSRRLFGETLVDACNDDYSVAKTEQLTGDSKLEALVLQGRAELRIRVEETVLAIKALTTTLPKKHVVVESAWALWLRVVVESLVHGCETAEDILDLFCDHDPVASSLLEGSPYMRQKLVAELAGLIFEATAKAREILRMEFPGYAKGDGRFNGISEFRYPWMAAEEDPLGKSRLTDLYERSLDLGGFVDSDDE